MSAAETALRSKGSLAWAYAMMISLSATLFALQASEVRAETFDFTFSGTSSAGGGPGRIIGGVITGSGGVITNISGTASGMSSVFIDGSFNYLGSNARDNVNAFRTYFYNSSTDYSFFFGLGDPNFQYMGFYSAFSDVSSLQGTTHFVGTSVVTSSSLAAPEIDGSVVPRAAFVMMGLFWIFKSRQRRLRLAEA
jgi:hypothetical protein